MIRILNLSLLGLFAFYGVCFAASETSFKNYVRQYQNPELIEDNNQALLARLKLLDLAPNGALVKVATFSLDNGKVAKTLAVHLCEATKRGVRVQLLIDSKSGDWLGRKNPFNASADAQSVEQIEQFMANCGIQVYIHNSFTDFVEYEGTRFPNIFNQAMHDGISGQSVGLPNFGGRLLEIVAEVSDISDEALSEQGSYGAMTSPFLVNLLHLGADFLSVQNNQNANSNIAKISNEYGNFIQDPIWQKVGPRNAIAALPTILRRFQEYPDVRDVYAQSRRFNRLNHKKMFEVRLPSGEGCLILGGRNLGDKYLSQDSSDDSYYDGDILICNQHDQALLKAAELSFNGLLKDEVDPLLDPSLFGSGISSPAINHVRLISKDSSARLPSISDLRRTVLEPYPNEEAVHGDLQITNATNWKLLVANWSDDPKADQVQQALLALIRSEQREIFIETAYAEFSQSLRHALEQALSRGVHVKIITNSFAETDGKSKVIRILMAPWENRMRTKFPRLFEISISTAKGGHMTHFKAAGFRCQAGASGFHKSFIVGSHNFHPRSGRTDKEHSLSWQEPAVPHCKDAVSLDSPNDLIGKREQFYKSARSMNPTADVLTVFRSLFDELRGAVSSQSSDPQGVFMAKVLKDVIYQTDGSLKYEAKTEEILNKLEESGLRDLIGSEF